MNTQMALGLPAAAPSQTVVINARCTLRAEEDQRVIVIGGLPVHHYCAADAAAEAYALVMLVESGFAQQTEVARAFGKSERTVHRRSHREQAHSRHKLAFGRIPVECRLALIDYCITGQQTGRTQRNA
jgi:hypothetical protein